MTVVAPHLQEPPPNHDHEDDMPVTIAASTDIPLEVDNRPVHRYNLHGEPDPVPRSSSRPSQSSNGGSGARTPPTPSLSFSCEQDVAAAPQEVSGEAELLSPKVFRKARNRALLYNLVALVAMVGVVIIVIVSSPRITVAEQGMGSGGELAHGLYCLAA